MNRIMCMPLARPLALTTVCWLSLVALLTAPAEAEGQPRLSFLSLDAPSNKCGDCWLSGWADNTCRLWNHDGCCRPQAMFAWQGQEMKYVDGSQDEPLQGDRPDFTESGVTVGMHRVQLESGYTYILDKRVSSHSFPETLLRVGMFAEWFEFRVAWNHGVNLTQQKIVSNIFDAGDDLYLGAKLGLFRQDGWRPEMGIILQANVPTGPPSLTHGEMEPGINWMYRWEISELTSIAGSTQVNRTRDDADTFYAEFAQSIAIDYTVTEKVGAFTEWFAFLPAGSAVSLPRHYFNGGITFEVHENLVLDLRLGVGLNAAADDLFAGSGMVVRL